MNSSRRLAISCLTALLAIPSVAGAQNSPRIGYVYPAGGRQGQTFRVVIGGQYLDGIGRAFFSGGGIEAATIEHVKPLTQKQFIELREQAGQLQERKSAAMRSTRAGKDVLQASGRRKGVSRVEGVPPSNRGPDARDAPEPAAWTVEDERMLAEIRKTLAERAPNRQANPAISETITLSVTITPDAEGGRREVRFMTAAGLSNPLVFHVSPLPEFVEDEPKGREGAGARSDRAMARAAQSEMPISLPAVVNGRILPGDVDRYRFAARKGQKLVIAASARELMPYLADAVPGWFQATLALYDADGRELAYADDYRFNPDPVLCFEIPGDGEYMVEIKDSIYRGREDFVYRIAMGELPFVTSIFPLGGPAGICTSIELEGWNLPVSQITNESVEWGTGGEIVDLTSHPSSIINHPSFAVDTLAECMEEESNDSPARAQKVALPMIVNGRIDKGGDDDVFSFDGRAGSEIILEVSARRLGSPLDSVLKLTDAAGRQLAINDDCEDKGEGLATHHADSRLRVELPSDGTYYVLLNDAQSKGGSEYGYRLRMSPPQPDFRLRLVPSSINLRGGATMPVTVYALRKDGFDGDISLALKDASSGFSLSGWVPAGQDKVQVTLTAPPVPTETPLTLSLEGRAVIDGRQVVRPVVPADDMEQAFFYRHLVVAQELKVAVSGQRMSKGDVRILGDVPIRIPAGGTATIRLGVSGRSFGGGAQLEVSDPPEGIVIEKATQARNVAEVVLRCDAGKVKPGLKGNLIVNAFYARPAAGKDKAPVNRARAPAAALPAIPFEIVAP